MSTLASRVGRGLGWSATGNIVLRFGNVVTSIVVARLIAPEEFGVFAVALTVWSILGTLAEFGLGTDLVRSRDPERRAPTVATLGVLTSGVLAASMALAAPGIAAAFASPESTDVIRLMAVSLAIFGFTIVPAARLQRDYRQRALFAVNACGMVASMTTVVVLASADVGPMALAWGQVANQVVLVLGLHLACRCRPRFGLRPDIARESLAFCLPLALANLVSWLLITLDNLIVARGLSATALGLYVLAFNVSSWPMNAIGQAIRVVALPAFSGVESAEVRNRALVRACAPIATLAVLMGLLLATLAEPTVTFLYGERWTGAAAALSGLAVFGALRVLLDLVATFLIAVGETGRVLVVQLVWLAAMVPAMVVGVTVFGLAGAGWSHVVVAVLVVLPAYGVCLRHTGVDVRRLLTVCVRPVVLAVPAALVCTWIGSRVAPPVVALLLGGVAATVLFVVPLLPGWRQQLSQLRSPQSEPIPATGGDDVLR